MTGSCWEWYKIHFYTKILDINIMLTFSTSEDTKSLKIANVRKIAIAYTIRTPPNFRDRVKSSRNKGQKYERHLEIPKHTLTEEKNSEEIHSI